MQAISRKGRNPSNLSRMNVEFTWMGKRGSTKLNTRYHINVRISVFVHRALDAYKL